MTVDRGYEIAVLSHAGHQRPTNEDHVACDLDRGVAIVADGVGGERGGEVAARTACEAILGAVATVDAEAPALHDAVIAAAERVAALATSELEGMGTTVAAIRIVPAEAIVEIAHVGDVRVYVLRATSSAFVPSGAPRFAPPLRSPAGASFVCTTRDHSSVCELVERGHLERAAALQHPLRNRISRALGRTDVRPDVRILALVPGDRLLACSDGLWAHVDDAAIAAVLESHDPAAACAALVELALAAGGPDNIGVAVVHWYGPRVRPPRAAEVAAQPAPIEEPLPAALRSCARDLTALARRGEFDPVSGRDRELAELGRALVQRRKANALLVGDPGVGKTSIVEAFATQIASGAIAPELAGLRVVEVSLTDLVAGTKYRGELEERIAAMIDAAEAAPELVLFVDEIHALVPASSSDGPGTTLANALKPALARGKLRVIGATTTAEYERHLARDEAFTRRFEVIHVAEPSPAVARTMLAGLVGKLEAHYKVRIAASALDAAVELSTRYMADRKLPDKAVDLLDRACARRVLDAGRGEVARREIARAVADRCGLPLALVERDAANVLVTLERGLRDRIQGQDAAIGQLVAALRRAHGPLRDPARPVLSCLLAGPTGVGKTTTAKLLAELVYGRDALVRIDMSEYAERHSVARLVGAPPGYVGHGEDGQLAGPVRRRPGCVVLLDEIEKAHPDVLLLLLQILGDGTLTDARGRATSFREAIVVMTTNLPIATRAKAGFAAAADAISDDDHRKVLAERLPPELVGRIDVVLAFRALGAADHAAIVDGVARRLEARLRDQGVTPPPGHEVRQLALARLAASQFGVRQVERIVEQVIGEALDAASAPPARDAVVLDSIRTRVQVAMLLVEIEQAAQFVIDAGETRFVATVQHLVTALRCHATAADLTFLKCTGDGVLAMYGSVQAALAAARELAAFEVAVRRVVHYGRVRHGPVGDFLGAEVQRLFQLDALAAVSIDGVLVSAAARDHLEEP